jgi:hypothetical protein
MESLTFLANKYGSDKGTKGPSTDWNAHNYTDIYEAYLWAHRHEPLRLVEVGLGVTGEAWRADIQRGRNQSGGASMKMWYDFFPKARIYGLDINPATHLDNDRISTHVVDQGDRSQLLAFADEFGEDGFDVIVDDGSHRPDHQQITLSALFGYLRPGGYYFIEDLMCNGIGDRDHGRYTDKSVLNTRRVLKNFAATGSFANPNKLYNSTELAAQIGGIRFHVPGHRTRFVWRSNAWRKPTRLLRPIHGFRDDSENICVLHRT